MDDGVDLYVEYLQSGVAQKINLDLIKQIKDKIVIENVGGSAYRTLSRVLNKLGISDKFTWFNIQEDPFSIQSENMTILLKEKRHFMITLLTLQ